jgi:hypothetical protein
LPKGGSSVHRLATCLTALPFPFPVRSAPLLVLAWLAWSALACGGAPPAVTSSAPADGPPDAAAPAEPEAPLVTAPPPESTRAPSTASFEQATAAPESVDVNDDHLHLTDAQLTGPMRGVLDRCAVPRNAKVTIKTAVYNGRAIGVTVAVVVDKPKSKKRPTKAAAIAEAKMKDRIVTCADHAVRAVTWPPSRRRDSFTTVF